MRHKIQVTDAETGLRHEARFESNFKFVLLVHQYDGKVRPVRRSNTRSKLLDEALRSARSGASAWIVEQFSDSRPLVIDRFTPGRRPDNG